MMNLQETRRRLTRQIDRFVRYAHVHRFKVKHTNKWQISTREVCRCGLSREIEMFPADDGFTNNAWWVYSDGTAEADTRVFNHT